MECHPYTRCRRQRVLGMLGGGTESGLQTNLLNFAFLRQHGRVHTIVGNLLPAVEVILKHGFLSMTSTAMFEAG